MHGHFCTEFQGTKCVLLIGSTQAGTFKNSAKIFDQIISWEHCTSAKHQWRSCPDVGLWRCVGVALCRRCVQLTMSFQAQRLTRDVTSSASFLNDQSISFAFWAVWGKSARIAYILSVTKGQVRSPWRVFHRHDKNRRGKHIVFAQARRHAPLYTHM